MSLLSSSTTTTITTTKTMTFAEAAASHRGVVVGEGRNTTSNHLLHVYESWSPPQRPTNSSTQQREVVEEEYKIREEDGDVLEEGEILFLGEDEATDEDTALALLLEQQNILLEYHQQQQLKQKEEEQQQQQMIQSPQQKQIELEEDEKITKEETNATTSSTNDVWLLPWPSVWATSGNDANKNSNDVVASPSSRTASASSWRYARNDCILGRPLRKYHRRMIRRKQAELFYQYNHDKSSATTVSRKAVNGKDRRTTNAKMMMMTMTPSDKLFQLCRTRRRTRKRRQRKNFGMRRSSSSSMSGSTRTLNGKMLDDASNTSNNTSDTTDNDDENDNYYSYDDYTSPKIHCEKVYKTIRLLYESYLVDDSRRLLLRDQYDNTPLHVVCANPTLCSHVPLIQYLIEQQQPNPNHDQNKSKDHKAIMNIPYDDDAGNNMGYTPLHCICQFNVIYQYANVSILQVLLQYNPYMTYRMEKQDHNTPLHLVLCSISYKIYHYIQKMQHLHHRKQQQPAYHDNAVSLSKFLSSCCIPLEYIIILLQSTKMIKRQRQQRSKDSTETLDPSGNNKNTDDLTTDENNEEEMLPPLGSLKNRLGNTPLHVAVQQMIYMIQYYHHEKIKILGDQAEDEPRTSIYRKRESLLRDDLCTINDNDDDNEDDSSNGKRSESNNSTTSSASSLQLKEFHREEEQEDYIIQAGMTNRKTLVDYDNDDEEDPSDHSLHIDDENTHDQKGTMCKRKMFAATKGRGLNDSIEDLASSLAFMNFGDLVEQQQQKQPYHNTSSKALSIHANNNVKETEIRGGRRPRRSSTTDIITNSNNATSQLNKPVSSSIFDWTNSSSNVRSHNNSNNTNDDNQNDNHYLKTNPDHKNQALVSAIRVQGTRRSSMTQCDHSSDDADALRKIQETTKDNNYHGPMSIQEQLQNYSRMKSTIPITSSSVTATSHNTSSKALSIHANNTVNETEIRGGRRPRRSSTADINTNSNNASSQLNKSLSSSIFDWTNSSSNVRSHDNSNIKNDDNQNDNHYLKTKPDHKNQALASAIRVQGTRRSSMTQSDHSSDDADSFWKIQETTKVSNYHGPMSIQEQLQNYSRMKSTNPIASSSVAATSRATRSRSYSDGNLLSPLQRKSNEKNEITNLSNSNFMGGYDQNQKENYVHQQTSSSSSYNTGNDKIKQNWLHHAINLLSPFQPQKTEIDGIASKQDTSIDRENTAKAIRRKSQQHSSNPKQKIVSSSTAPTSSSTTNWLHDHLDVIKCLIDCYPDALFIKNHHNKLPIDMIPLKKSQQTKNFRKRSDSLDSIAETNLFLKDDGNDDEVNIEHYMKTQDINNSNTIDDYCYDPIHSLLQECMKYYENRCQHIRMLPTKHTSVKIDKSGGDRPSIGSTTSAEQSTCVNERMLNDELKSSPDDTQSSSDTSVELPTMDQSDNSINILGDNG